MVLFNISAYALNHKMYAYIEAINDKRYKNENVISR